MKVLSLFDGMSCGQLALQRLGIEVDKYYASEIDKYAIQVTQANFPNTIQIGDVKAVKPEDYADVDLIICGSPCQGFSFAGKQLAFDDPRSALFFEFIRILKQVKPKYFLLENVRMKKEFIEIISQQVSECYPELPGTDLFDSKIEPILINSALLSAQSRQRLYWTNIPNVKQPEDLGIVLKDILEDEVEEHYLAGKNLLENYQGGNQLNPNYKSQANTIHDKNKKSGVICAGTHGYANDYVETKPIQVNPSKKASGKQPYIQDRVFHEDGKSHSLTASFADRTNVATRPIKVGMNIEEVKVRKHKIDIEHLQRFLEVYKKRSKKTQKQIATELDVPLTQVSHWFRTDSCFSIPPADLWLSLRKVINADNDSYDKKIMEFEYRDGVYETKQRVYSDQGKAPTLTASNKEQMIETKPKQVGNNKKQYISKQSVEKYVEDVNADFNDPYNKKTIKGNKSTALRTNSSNGNMWVNEKALKETKPKQVGIASDIKGHDILKRVYSPEGKSPTLNSMGGGNREPKVATKKSHPIKANYYKSSRANFENDTSKGSKFSATGVQSEDLTWRKLTPLECERLQTVPDNYTNHVSNTQRYRMLGNGFTVSVIAHILKNMEI